MAKSFGKKLQELRGSAGLSLVALGEIAHVAPTMISAAENGIRVPGRVTLEKLASAFKLKGTRKYEFMLSGLQLSKRDHVLPDVARFGSEIVNALGLRLLMEAGIDPSDVTEVEKNVTFTDASGKTRNVDFVIHMKSKKRIGVEIKTFTI